MQSGTPILYATPGETLCEKSGALNLGVEGIMMVGALAGFMAAASSGSPLLGFLAVAAIGTALQSGHYFVDFFNLRAIEAGS